MTINDDDIFHYVLSNYTPFVYAILNREQKKGNIPQHVEVGDLIAGDDKGYSPVIHGLLKAIHTYDPNKNTSLESHIYSHVVAKARDHIKSKDVASTDIVRAAKYSKLNPSAASKQTITVKPSSSMRAASESLGISGGDEDGMLEFGFERDDKRKFAEQNPNFVNDEIARKVKSYEAKHTTQSTPSKIPTPAATATSASEAQPKVETPPAQKAPPKISVRRKGIENVLSPEQRERMVRIDSAKAARKDGGK